MLHPPHSPHTSASRRIAGAAASVRRQTYASVLIPPRRGGGRTRDRPPRGAGRAPRLPGGDRLIGELGGRIVAALEICSGRAVADPFAPTSAIVELLGVRAAQVRR